ncbi:hypothetical protein AFK68_25260, partial [Hydrocoleum sp. CS-953]|uniref:hypothetical protein n=1 Tax=Hydrocoleum sp. CS-953 TaxID=1671698 RepID=UPI000BC6113B
FVKKTVGVWSPNTTLNLVGKPRVEKPNEEKKTSRKGYPISFRLLYLSFIPVYNVYSFLLRSSSFMPKI